MSYDLGTARSIVQKQYHPDENELFYRTAELGTVPADEYVSSVLRNDLIGILRDIREAHPKNAKGDVDISPVAVIEEFQKKVHSVIEGEESPGARIAKIYLATYAKEKAPKIKEVAWPAFKLNHATSFNHQQQNQVCSYHWHALHIENLPLLMTHDPDNGRF